MSCCMKCACMAYMLLERNMNQVPLLGRVTTMTMDPEFLERRKLFGCYISPRGKDLSFCTMSDGAQFPAGISANPT